MPYACSVTPPCILCEDSIMKLNSSRTVIAVAIAGALSGCGELANLPFSAGVGHTPTLPAPNQTLIPTVNIAPAIGWPSEVKPQPAAGLAVTAFATQLDHPRWVYVLPNGDVLVAETNRPPAEAGRQ